MRHLTLLVAALCGLALSPFAFAAERTVCFHLRLADDRYNCATPSDNGARRPCNDGSYVDAVGHQVELWDRDFNSDDDLIGTWYIAGEGTQCITFEWENASSSKGEPHPDLYLRYINIVNRVGYSNYITVKAVTTGGDNHPATTWRNGQPNDPDRYISLECTTNQTCYMFPSGSLVPTNDVASERALRIMALDSAQHTLQALGEQMNRHIRLHYPGKSDCTTSCAPDRENFHIFSTQGGDGILVGHEMGHNLQMQRFNQDDLRDDLSKGGAGWNNSSDEHDSGATTEGFASYVGVVSWYEPNRFDTQPIGWGLNFESATLSNSTCSQNRGIPVQVAKAFWDMDDWLDEAGAGAASSWPDTLHYRTEDIVTGWDSFPNGSGNRENDESDQQGVNMRDFYENNINRYTAAGFFTTFIEHNCLTAQDNN